MTLDEGIAAMEAALDGDGIILPDLDAGLGDCDFQTVEDVPELREACDDDGHAKMEIPDDARGLYVGPMFNPEDTDSNLDGGMIYIVAAPHDNAAEFHHTLNHEIAHALGYDETEVAAMGLE